MMIIFLTVISQCSSFSLWDQMRDSAPVLDVPEKPAVVTGGFWGTLLGHPTQQKQHSEQNSLRNSQQLTKTSARLVDLSKRKVLPSSLRSLHTLNTDYDDYDTLSGG